MLLPAEPPHHRQGAAEQAAAKPEPGGTLPAVLLNLQHGGLDLPLLAPHQNAALGQVRGRCRNRAAVITLQVGLEEHHGRDLQILLEAWLVGDDDDLGLIEQVGISLDEVHQILDPGNAAQIRVVQLLADELQRPLAAIDQPLVLVADLVLANDVADAGDEPVEHLDAGPLLMNRRPEALPLGDDEVGEKLAPFGKTAQPLQARARQGEVDGGLQIHPVFFEDKAGELMDPLPVHFGARSVAEFVDLGPQRLVLRQHPGVAPHFQGLLTLLIL